MVVSPIRQSFLIIDEPDRTLHGQYIREEPVEMLDAGEGAATAANLSLTENN